MCVYMYIFIYGYLINMNKIKYVCKVKTYKHDLHDYEIKLYRIMFYSISMM